MNDNRNRLEFLKIPIGLLLLLQVLIFLLHFRYCR